VIIEGLDAHMVARAEQRLAIRVPDDEREVAEHVLDGRLTPAEVGAQDEVAVGGVSGRFEEGAELGAVVESRIRGETEAFARRVGHD